MRTRWWLRSTVSSYGRPVLEAAYGEMIVHSTESVWKILAWEKWLGCRHDTSPMVDIPGSTLVWAQYMSFFDFKIWKLICIMFWKSIIIMKKILVVLDVVLARRCSGNVFDLPWCFLYRNENPQICYYSFSKEIG